MTGRSVMAKWDLLTSCALVFTAFATPYEVGFLEAPTSGSDPLFVINRLVDLVFGTDTVLTFFVMYQIRGSNAFDLRDASSAWETRLHKIAARYLRGPFVIDFIAVGSSAFDIVALVTPASSVCMSERGFNPGKLARLIRLLRVAKMLRLIRASRILKRMERRNTVQYAYISFIFICCQVLVITHWMSCTFGVASGFADSRLDTWLGTHGLCWPAVSAAHPDAHDECGNRLVSCMPPNQIYMYTFYWSLGLITGYASEPLMGPAPEHYSDTTSFPELGTSHAAFRPYEILLLILMGLIAAALWAYVTARLVDIILNADPDTTSFRRTMDDLNRFASYHALNFEHALALREYFHEKRDLMRAENRATVAQGLSPLLQAKIGWEVNKVWMVQIPFFAAAEKPFLSDIACALRHAVYVPTERPPVSRLYVVFQGVCRYMGRTLARGQHFGERDVLMRNTYMGRPSATAVSYLHVHFVGREAIEQIAAQYPSAHRAMRMHVIKEALRDYLVTQLRASRAAQKRWRKSSLISHAVSSKNLGMLTEGRPLPVAVASSALAV